MYAIVEIAGQQFKVENGAEVFVNRLDAETGSKVEFGKVLLVDNAGVISVGKPLVDGASVSATILSHDRADKIIIFKKKRRKGYQKSSGHRQNLTKILIENISA